MGQKNTVIVPLKFCGMTKKMYYVDMQMDGRSELRGMTIHSERYAEDCAENFVMGYGEFRR